MIKHEHKIFPSDIFLIFETVGAKLVLGKMIHFKKFIT